jgi:hypothetical protein
MRIQGHRANITSEIIRAGSCHSDRPEIKWFEANGLIDPNTGEVEALLYWEAIRNDILHVVYMIKVVEGRPALIIDQASVTTGSVGFGTPTRMLSHAVGLGLCPGERLTLAVVNRRNYQVVHR